MQTTQQTKSLTLAQSQQTTPLTHSTSPITSPAKFFYGQRHPFHILSASPFPVAVAFWTFVWLVPTVFYMHGVTFWFLPRGDLMHLGFLGLFATVLAWFLRIIKESAKGFHTRKVQNGLRMGMLLFILSEVMFFFAFFWGFFHFTLIPSVAIGTVWPPVGTQPLDVWGLPLANTLLLLASGVTITIAHACLINDTNPIGTAVSANRRGFQWYLFLTILLGVTFLICQAYEYKYGVKFSWRENIYGSIFFITTGFHGLHVTIGTMFLAFCLTREYLTRWAYMPNGESTLSSLLGRFGILDTKALASTGAKRLTYGFEHNHHFGFEAAAWYWHFVDVVWLFLFITVYWWGGAQTA